MKRAENRVNVFDVNVTNEQDEDLLDGEIFVTQKRNLGEVSDSDNPYESFRETASSAVKSTLGLQITAAVALIISNFFRSNIRAAKFAEAAEEQPILFWCAVGFFALAIVLLILLAVQSIRDGKKIKAVERELTKQMEEEKQLACQTFCVPAGAKEIDVLWRCYWMKRKRKKYTFGRQYINANQWVYSCNGNLCFVDETQQVSVPLEQIVGISPINRKIRS